MNSVSRSLVALALLISVLPASVLAQDKRKSKISLPFRKEEAKVAFNAADPSAKENQNTEGTPWEKVSTELVPLPEGIKPAIPEPLPDLDKISEISYNSAVSLAFESLRLIYGEMSEADAEKFMEMWAPLFEYPTQEIIDYLNKLNPLLSQFLVAREAYLNTAANIELLVYDASEAVGWEDEQAFKSAMFEARLGNVMLKRLDAAMTELANRITALGNPPNPLESMAEARSRYKRGFSQKEIYLGETWMGTRVDREHSVRGLPELTETMMRYLMKVKVNGEDRWFVLELKENGIPEESEDDPYGVGNVMVDQMVFSDTGYLMPEFKSDGKFQTYYPQPPVLAITALTMSIGAAFESSYVSEEDKKDPDYAAAKQAYHLAAGSYVNRVLRAGVFFKTALMWGYEDKWNTYEFKDNGLVPDQAIEDFEEALKEQFVIEAENAKNLPKINLFGGRKKGKEEADQAEADSGAALVMDQESARKQQVRDSLAREEQSKKESIACLEENLASMRADIQRDYRDRANAAAKRDESLVKYYDQQILFKESTISSMQDNIDGLKTGTFVHTRTQAEEYDYQQVCYKAKVEAERNKIAHKMTAVAESQVKYLPEDEQDDARDRIQKMYEDGTIANDDVESLFKLTKAFNYKIEGARLKEQAEAEEAIAYADLKEAGANAVIMAAGSITVGLAGEALAGAFGTGAAATVWGARTVGAVYGGVTGYISGGPGKAASSAANFFHPVTGTIASFIEGYTAEGNEGKSTWEKVWEGTKQAGQDYLVGKAFEIGATDIAKTAAMFLPDGIVHFNLTGNNKLDFKQKLDVMRTQRERLEAEDAVKAFSKRNNEYISMLADGKTPQATLDATRKEINQLAASLNADYHAKWYMKYKADPNLRAHFDQAVQSNYREMIPKMEASLKQQGYDLTDIEFRQFRNSSSGGSSSMDLDLAPVSTKTGKEPVFYKNGEKTTANQFMQDAQKTMNMVYHEQTGISAKASEMNLTTSAHPEAYSTTKLLEKNVDYSSLTPDDVASIGKVLEVKVNTIEGNVRMTETAKLQAKCRESTKEIDNMLVPKLKQELKNATDVKQAERLSIDIEYWQDMSNKLGAIGKQTNNPYEIHKLNGEIKRATGGRDAMQVVNDLIHEFNPSFKPSAQ